MVIASLLVKVPVYQQVIVVSHQRPKHRGNISSSKPLITQCTNEEFFHLRGGPKPSCGRGLDLQRHWQTCHTLAEQDHTPKETIYRPLFVLRC
jgi:hypothetical protein